MQAMHEDYIKPSVAAKRLKVSVKKIYSLIHKGELYAINFGSDKKPLYRVSESSLVKHQINKGE